MADLKSPYTLVISMWAVSHRIGHRTYQIYWVREVGIPKPHAFFENCPHPLSAEEA